MRTLREIPIEVSQKKDTAGNRELLRCGTRFGILADVISKCQKIKGIEILGLLLYQELLKRLSCDAIQYFVTN